MFLPLGCSVLLSLSMVVEIFEGSLEGLNSFGFGETGLSWTSLHVLRCECPETPPIPHTGNGMFSTSKNQSSWTERKLRPVSTLVKLVETRSENQYTETFFFLNYFFEACFPVQSSFTLETGGKGFWKVRKCPKHCNHLLVHKPSYETRMSPSFEAAASSLARKMVPMRRVKEREKQVFWGSRGGFTSPKSSYPDAVTSPVLYSINNCICCFPKGQTLIYSFVHW